MGDGSNFILIFACEITISCDVCSQDSSGYEVRQKCIEAHRAERPEEAPAKVLDENTFDVPNLSG